MRHLTDHVSDLQAAFVLLAILFAYFVGLALIDWKRSNR